MKKRIRAKEERKRILREEREAAMNSPLVFSLPMLGIAESTSAPPKKIEAAKSSTSVIEETERKFSSPQ